ncbi:MAG TPA: DUF5132 domain-containing protein [Candidatus Limnocylindrales bacterium]|nr:DUF5132 domain-containing protein [Candidatus Limnocylindrales bacterium]
MALLDDLRDGLGGSIATGLAIGVGATILSPVVIPIAANVVKPLAKAAIKSGILIYEKGRELVAEAGEMVEDIIAEAKAELSETSQKTSPIVNAKGEPIH